MLKVPHAEGREFSTSKEKATCFGKFFSDKCSLQNDYLQPSELPHFPRRTTSVLRRVRFRQAAIARELKKLDPSKATGPDGIPARVLQQCASTLSLPLSRLFSLCFRHGVQPSMWKIANVVPIYKRHSRSEARNYRPVSLLSIMSKVMEEGHQHIKNEPPGKKGTALGAPIWVQSWPQRSRPSYQPAAEPSMAVEYQRRRRCSSAAVDIAGAFDKVSHVGVLHKLCAYGINGILHRWLTSYLSNRNLQAVVGGSTSRAFPVTAGVPQGSILGPTLFIVYVNDAPDVLPANTVPATYADDTTLVSLIPSIDDVPARCTEFQSGVDALSRRVAALRKVRRKTTLT